MNKLILKIGIPIALAVSFLWAIRQFVNQVAAIKAASLLLIFIIVLLVLWLFIWLGMKLFSRISKSRARKEQERAAEPAFGVKPEHRSQLEALQSNLNEALKLIKESKLARGRKTAEALYAVPWILMLGPAGSGKTAALEACGVEFPYVAGDRRRRGSGDSEAGCRYWFARDAVVLDLDGRIATEEEEFEVFTGFLDQLKRARSERPLDGIVVTVSVREIMDQSPEQVRIFADRLRQRFDAMIRRLEIRFPIYVLFTKCDQIVGFSEFFGGLRSRDRAQVWGATISKEQRKRQPVDQIFHDEFDRLATVLGTYRLQMMESEKSPAKLPKIFSFPLRFVSLRKKLEEFISALLQPTPYSERPMFRGFYLASAARAAVPEVQGERSEIGWDPNRRLAAPQEQPQEARTYFLENLFPRVIFADRPLARPAVQTRLRRRLWTDIAFFSILALCVIFLIGIIYSFSGNRALIESTRLATMRLTDAGWDGKRTTDLMAMQQLRQRVEELDRFREEGPRWALRWGLYSGDAIADSGRRVYLRRLRESFVTPTAKALRQRLYSFSTGAENAANYAEFYSYLRAYMMMGEPPRSEASFLNNTLAPFWKSLVPLDAQGVALEQLRFYTQLLPKNDPELQITPDGSVVTLARRSLSQYPAIERIYARLKDEGSRKYQPYTLAQATGGKSLEYLNSSHDVPGVFTEAGWSGYFKNAVGQAGKEVVSDDWVLGSASGASMGSGATEADYERQLRDKYFAEYGDEWMKFLEGISVRPLSDLSEARAALDSLSQQDSALTRLLMNVAANTMLRKEPEKGTSISSMVSSALTTIGLSTPVNRADLVDAVSAQFQPLHELVTSPDGGKTPSMVAQYILALGKVQVQLESLFGAGVQWDKVKLYVDQIANNIVSNEFQDAYRVSGLVNRQCTTRSTRPVAPLLEKPLRETWAAILRDVSYRLDGLWKTQISDNFKRDFENNFPFNPTGRDIPLSTLAQFLKPNDGTLDAFYQKELKMFVEPTASGYAPRFLINEQVAFSPVFLEFLGKMSNMRQALFPPGAPDVSVAFDLTPDSTPGVSESLLEMDGQRLRYRNEPPVPNSMMWPSKSSVPQAKLSISIGGSGERPGIQLIEGEWALFRLLGQARISSISQTTYTVNWSLPGSDGRRFDVRYKLQARSIRNPFAPDFFKGAICPERVSQQPVSSTNYGVTR
jgi:type VI secretion system protein ImpL